MQPSRTSTASASFFCVSDSILSLLLDIKRLWQLSEPVFLGVESHASSQGIRQVAFSSTNILVHICTLPTIETCFNCIGTRSSNANKRIKTTKKFRHNFKVGGSRQNGASAWRRNSLVTLKIPFTQKQSVRIFYLFDKTKNKPTK